MGLREDLVDEVEDLAVDGWFEEQHELPVALDGAEQLEVLQRVADAWCRTELGELVAAQALGEKLVEDRGRSGWRARGLSLLATVT